MIKVEHLSKEYLIRHNSAAKYSSLRDELMGKVRGVFRKDESKTMERFMALNDVSFEVNQGDRVGIIGRNGAGKSTLLKVLSRIVTPTSGKITIEGRVASLLEVGTGFHPELTGRENIFLNGSILGMSREEIRSKFDEIVAFSEVEKFLDTPVKRYSSGMYVRLAFSVAAHLEPEILIVDEVLAVGDAAFQKKCLGKMKDVSGQGRTVLFVSHNMAAVRNLCEKALLLNRGMVEAYGASDVVLDRYLSSDLMHSLSARYARLKSGENDLSLVEAFIRDVNGLEKDSFEIIEDVFIEMRIQCNKLVPNLYAYVVVKNSSDEIFIESDTMDVVPNSMDFMKLGSNAYSLKIDRNVLGVGEYTVYVSFASTYADQFSVDVPGDILRFTIADTITQRGHHRRSFTSQLLKWDYQ